MSSVVADANSEAQASNLGAAEEQAYANTQGEADASGNANGILAGTGLPATDNPIEAQLILSLAEGFLQSVGFEYVITPGMMQQAYSQNITVPSEAAQLWGKQLKLPESKQFVYYGMSASQFDSYKQSNRQAIIDRYGIHADQNDANFVKNMAAPTPSFESSASAVTQASTAIPVANKTVVR